MAVSSPFEGCTVTLSGTWKSLKQDAIYKQIEDHGGSISKAIGDSITHLITTESDFKKPSAKVRNASEFPDIKIVTIEWMQDSISKGVKIAEEKYLLDPVNAATNDADIGANGDSQHIAKPSLGGAHDRDDVKNIADGGKKRARNGKSKAVSQATQEENEADGPLVKKSKSSLGAASQATSTQLVDKHAPGLSNAQKKEPNIPVDEGCPLAGTHRVYIAKDGTIYDALLNQTNAGANNNKFYRIQLLTNGKSNYDVWTRWGRVGDRGQTALLGSDGLDNALKQFDKKFKDKSGLAWRERLGEAKLKKYVFLERNYESDSSDDEKENNLPGAGSRRSSKASIKSIPPAESKLPEQVQNLMALIFNLSLFASAMADMNYDANKLPLGKLSKRTLELGYRELKKLAAVITDSASAMNEHGLTPQEAIEQFTNSYYSYIPHAFGRRKPPVIGTEQMLKREVEMLESLSDMRIAEEIMKESKTKTDSEPVHPADQQFIRLGLSEMTPLERKSTEFKELEQYLLRSQGDTHGHLSYELQDIFRIERNGEHDRFEKSEFSKIENGDRRLLWHGSRTTNFGGILSQGLRIAPPEAPVSGYMFAKGIYLADMSSKSGNYTYSYQSNNTGLLLLCEAELGKPMLELRDADSYADQRAKEQGSISTWGKGTVGPKGWKDAGCVHPGLKGIQMPDTTEKPGTVLSDAYLQYNEYICYDVAQIRLRYLLRVKM